MEEATLVGIVIDTTKLPSDPSGGVEIHVGETVGLTIVGDYNTGTTRPVAGGLEPEVSWATEPKPSGAIALNGLTGGNQIGLTANELTSEPGVLQAKYDGFEAHLGSDECRAQAVR